MSSRTTCLPAPRSIGSRIIAIPWLFAATAFANVSAEGRSMASLQPRPLLPNLLVFNYLPHTAILLPGGKHPPAHAW